MKVNKSLIAKFITNNKFGDNVIYKIIKAENNEKAKIEATDWFYNHFEKEHLKEVEIVEPVKY